MGKMPAMPQPEPFKPAETYEDDKLVSAQFLEGGKIINKMISTKEERENKERREKNIAELEEDMDAFRPKLNTLEPEFQADIDEEAGKMSEAATANFRKSYDPMLKEIQEESAKKFGTLSNSFYQDERKKLMEIAASTQGEIARDIEGRKSELRKDELGNRQNYFDSLTKQLGYLQQGVNDFYDKQNQNYEQNLKASDLYNSWSMKKYQTQMEGYKAQLQYKAQRTSAILGMFSDRRLKENIQEIEAPLETIEKINGYNFNWKHTQEQDIGVMAQELDKVLPRLVGVDEATGYKKVNYNGLIPVLIEAVKELSDKVKELEKNG